MRRIRKIVFILALIAIQVYAIFWIVDFAFKKYEKNSLLSYAPIDAGIYDPKVLLLNDHGERIIKTKPKDEFRILAIGDSYTFASTLPNLSYCAILERKLSTIIGRPVRVVNVGYPGISFPEYIDDLFFWSQALEYDAVLSNIFIGNDFEDVRHEPYAPKAIEQDLKELCRRGLVYGPNTLVPQLYGFRFFDYIKAKFLNKILRYPSIGRLVGFEITDGFPVPPGYRPTLLHMSQKLLNTKYRTQMQSYNRTLLWGQDHGMPWLQLYLAVLARYAARGVPVLVTISPPACIMEPSTRANILRSMGLTEKDIDQDMPRRVILEVARRVKLPLEDIVDLTPCLSGRTPSGEATYGRETHWSLAGNAWVGDMLADILARRWFHQDQIPQRCPQPAPAFEPIPKRLLSADDLPQSLVDHIVNGCPKRRQATQRP